MTITERNVVIDSLGRLPTVSFPSGTIVEGAEENTLQPGIKVILTEQEINPKSLAYFNEALSSQAFMYKITAFQEPSNSAGSKAYVTTIEKPFTVTIPTNANGLCYLGVRESDTDPWRFQRVGNQNENPVNIASFRFSTDIGPNDCSFKLHRLGTTFCLAIYNGSNAKDLPETIVDTLFASSTTSIQVKDGKYLEDLKIKGVLKGLKLGNIKPADFMTRITYRSNKSTEAPIKINGTAVKQTTKADKTVPGYSYYHTFLVDNVTDFSLISTNGDFNFTMNLKDQETSNFPSGFLLEFFNKVDSQNILPYSYTEFYTINKTDYVEEEKKEEEEEEEEEIEVIFYDIAYELNGGSFVIDNPTKYSNASEAIFLTAPIKEGYLFTGWTGSNGDNPQISVIIEKGSTGDKTYTANWVENLTNRYSVTLAKGRGIGEVSGGGTYEEGEEVTASCTILPGYEFDFWTGNNTQTTFTMPNHDVVMQANAKLINYTIYCDLNEGTLNAGNPTCYNVESNNITLINPVRFGYTFKGWSGTDLEGKENLAVTIPKGSIGNRKYLANWNLDTYTITCNIGEGNLPESNPTTYDVNSADITLNNPVSTRDYFYFKGWSGTDLEGSENMTVTIPLGSVGNREYTANYAPEVFSISYEYEGEMEDNPDSYDVTTLSFMLNNPTREGYCFIGWEGTDIPQGTASRSVKIYKGSTGNRNYVASFTPNYSITYNLDGGTADNPTSYNVFSDEITLNNPPNHNGFTFLGWIGTGINDPTMTVVIPNGSTGDREYTAIWSSDIIIKLSDDIFMTLKRCPAGTFMMGSPANEYLREADEIQHQVTISKDFWIGRLEVMVNEFVTVMGYNPAYYAPFGAMPVESITWEEAKEFCNRLNAIIASDSIPLGYYFDLPTEAQWEYACRAETTSMLNIGVNPTTEFDLKTELDKVAILMGKAQYNYSTYGGGLRRGNAWGLFDMHGNVEEWCRDWYGEYPTTAVSDPVGPDTGTNRVCRGGGIGTPYGSYRSAARRSETPTTISSCRGLRLALVPLPTPAP